MAMEIANQPPLAGIRLYVDKEFAQLRARHMVRDLAADDEIEVFRQIEIVARMVAYMQRGRGCRERYFRASRVEIHADQQGWNLPLLRPVRDTAQDVPMAETDIEQAE